MISIYVVDTSYLLELADCDGCSVPAAVKEVRKRFKREAGRGARFYVPLPCIFELGNHIAGVKHDRRRKQLADWLLNTVKASLDTQAPWHITPTGKPEEILPELMDAFVSLAEKRRIGLVDTFTIGEARRLKATHANAKLKIHIWTNDHALKASEPDKEPSPYLWKSDGTLQ